MSGDASITLTWGDGERLFRLAIGQLRELQEKCGVGPPEVLDRLAGRRWRVDDVRETIRLGLIGGGASPPEAHRLAVRYVEGRPWLESVPVAHAVMLAALIGAPGEPVGKKAAAAEAESKATTGASPSPRSMASAPRSGSRRRRSTQ